MSLHQANRKCVNWEQKLIILKLPAEIDVKGYVPYPLVVSHKLGKLTVEFFLKNSSGCNWLKPFFFADRIRI